MIQAVVFGDSHTLCIAQAAKADPERMGGVPVYRFAGKRSIAGDGSISIKEAIGLTSKLSPMVPIFLSIVGGFHNILGLVRQEPDFDFLLDSHATMENLDVVDIVPYRAMVSAFDFYIEQSTKFLAIKRAARGPVFLIGTPPPKESNAFIMEKFSRAQKQEYRGRNVIEIGLNTPQLRRKLWELECKRSKKWFKEQGIYYLPAPGESFCSKRFLKECYYADITHANSEYGRLVLEQILEIVRGQREDIAHG